MRHAATNLLLLLLRLDQWCGSRTTLDELCLSSSFGLGGAVLCGLPVAEVELEVSEMECREGYSDYEDDDLLWNTGPP